MFLHFSFEMFHCPVDVVYFEREGFHVTLYQSTSLTSKGTLYKNKHGLREWMDVQIRTRQTNDAAPFC